ncbi:MAG: GIY-YIG nuclease family protein [Hyphomicrobium sp.]
MHAKAPTVYIMASRRNGTLYIGVTSYLSGRNAEHKQDLIEGFTKRYGVHLLVHYQTFSTMPDAIAREKKLKKWPRAKKIALIEATNPHWLDLTEQIADWRE